VASVAQTAGRSPGLGTVQAWWMVAALFAIYVLSWLDRLILAMLVRPIKDALHLSDFQTSILLGPAFAVAYAVFAIPLGWAADRFSRRAVICVSTLVWATATASCAFAENFQELLLLRICVGIGEAALLPAAYSLIADGFPPERVTVATATFQTAGKVGSALAFGIGGLAVAYAAGLGDVRWPLLGDAQPWQITMAMIGLPGFVLAALAFSFPEPGRRSFGAGANPSRAEFTGFLKRNAVLFSLLLFAFSCLSLVGHSLTNWVPTYIDRTFGLDPPQYGPMLSLMNLVGAASLPVSGWVVDRFYRGGMRDAHLRVYGWMILGLSPAIIYAFFATNVYVFLACYALIQFITVPFIVYASAVIALLAPSRLRGRLLGACLFVFSLIGLGVGPTLVGALTDFAFHDESKVGYSLAIIVIVASGAALVAMRLALPRLRGAVAKAQGAEAPEAAASSTAA
jgi:MFS family permease